MKNNNEQNSTKTNINWYPGHMAKTRKQITEDLKLVDIVIELLDARIPVSSQNPDIAEIIKEKKRLIVLNKSDLADEKQNQKWISYFQSKGISVVLTDANTGRGMEQILRELEKMMEEELKILAQKGRTGRRIRAMILGIPNVGKSSLINRIAKKATAGVGNRPGITKQKQWIRLNERVELLDTPGVLWPKFESEEVALHLAFTGSIKEEVLEKTEVAYFLTKFLLENYCQNLCERYKIEQTKVEEILRQEQPENSNIYEVMLAIGKKRGCVIAGGKIDEEKTAKILLDEFKNGGIGRITLESPLS